jgi:hypothetical protein
MLVHKATMGVLDRFWTGRYAIGRDGTPEPVMEEYSLKNSGLAGDEWWFVARGSALGRRVRSVYPCCTPVTDEAGKLIAVIAWPRRMKAEKEAPAQTKRRRPYRKRGILEDLLGEE